jgi:hypothetical protein
MECDVQDHCVIPYVEMMPVRGPLAGVNVHLDVTAEKNRTDPDQRVVEIRTAVIVRHPRGENGDGVAVRGAEDVRVVKPVFPEVSQPLL